MASLNVLGILGLNPIALRMAKTQLSFGCSECNRVKLMAKYTNSVYAYIVNIYIHFF